MHKASGKKIAASIHAENSTGGPAKQIRNSDGKNLLLQQAGTLFQRLYITVRAIFASLYFLEGVQRLEMARNF
jgi:hypothetical protein